MTISVDIHPTSNKLCMINDPDASSAYSLSGHVSVSLSSTANILDRPRPEKVLLHSLTLIFEGQAELITHESGYSGARLCKVTRELAPARPMLLSNDYDEDANGSDINIWNFVFDLTVPGWVPSSSVYGSGLGGRTPGTSYSLFAEAHFTPAEDTLHSRGWSLSSLCAPFIPRIRVVLAPRKEIKIVRYMTPSVVDELTPSSAFPNVQFAVRAQPNAEHEEGAEASSGMPADVLSKIDLRASVPERVNMEDRSFVLTLRLRTAGLSDGQQQRLRLSQFRLLLTQQEVYNRRPFRSYTSAYPLPSSQPDNEPLLHEHPMKYIIDIGFASVNSPASQIRSSFSLLSEKHLGRHDLPSGGISLQPAADVAEEQTWTRVDVSVPFEHVVPGQDESWEERQHGRVKALRADEESPFFRVWHNLEVELTFTYDSERTDDDPSVERLCFSVPVKFARVPPVKAQNSLALPPYSQLFHSNGERRTDNTVPLPAYTPREESTSVVQSIDLDKPSN